VCICADVASRRQEVCVLPPGVARGAHHRVAMLTTNTAGTGYQTMPGSSRRTTAGVGHPTTADYAYQQQQQYPYNFHHDHHQQQQKRRRNGTWDARTGSNTRYNSATLPRRDNKIILTSSHDTGSTVNTRSPTTGCPPGVATASGSSRIVRGGRSMLALSVSDDDITGTVASHLSPHEGATDHRLPTDTHAFISKSLLALPDTDI